MNPERPLNIDAVEALLRIGGRRAEPPHIARERAWSATLATWQRRQERRRNWQIGGWLAAAAAVVAAVGALISLRPGAGPAPVIASLGRSVGTVEIRRPDASDWKDLASNAGPALSAGTSLRTQGGSLAGLGVGQGVSVRLNEATQVELVSEREIRLLRGVVYVDTGPGGHAGQLQVSTESATFEDFGTQFEVSSGDDGVRLRVREGQVVIAHGGDRLVARAEQQVDIDVQGSVRRSGIARGDPAWAWVAAVAPPAPTDGQPLAALVRWVARETGRPVRYADTAVEQEATATVLHGQLSGLAPLETLDVMMATTRLTYAIGTDQVIEVSRRTD